jgi:hypothetical protein
MFEIQVFKTPPNMPAEEYIKVRVLPGPDERSQMGDWEHMTRSSAGHLRVNVIENGPKPLREAWESAKEYAASATVSVIYLEDSYGQFGLQV